MTTNYFTPLNPRARDILCHAYRTEMAIALRQSPTDWETYRRATQRIDAIRALDGMQRIALDQGEFELLGEQVPA